MEHDLYVSVRFFMPVNAFVNKFLRRGVFATLSLDRKVTHAI
jgi:hypothetical protein